MNRWEGTADRANLRESTNEWPELYEAERKNPRRARV